MLKIYFFVVFCFMALYALQDEDFPLSHTIGLAVCGILIVLLLRRLEGQLRQEAADRL